MSLSIRLCDHPSAQRWLDLYRADGVPFVRVGRPDGEEDGFEVGFDHLMYVELGMSYQAWGKSGHVIFRRDGETIAIEYGASVDRRAVRCRIPLDEYRSVLTSLNDQVSPAAQASAR